MARVLDEAVAIRQWDWSETSQTVSLFTRAHGLVRAVAKGARRATAPYSGGVEPLTRADCQLILKPGAELALLTSWDLLETFHHLRRSLAAFHGAFYMADLVQHLVGERDPHPGLYDQLVACLRALGGPPGPLHAVVRFQWAAVVEAGYRPELDHSVASGAPLAPARTYLFSARLGGLAPEHELPLLGTLPARVRPRESDTAPAHAAPGAWRVRAATVDLLRAMAASPDGPAVDDQAPDLFRAGRLLAQYLVDILGREPRTHAAAWGDRGALAPPASGTSGARTAEPTPPAQPAPLTFPDERTPV